MPRQNLSDKLQPPLFKNTLMFLKQYFQESFQELHNVTWPTKRQAVKITVLVLIFMLVSAVVLGLVDELLAIGYQTLLNFKLTLP